MSQDFIEPPPYRGPLTLEALDAGAIEPSTKRYRVTNAQEHKTLSVGDVVVMVHTPRFANYLLRESDMTLHHLSDDRDQYVHLVEVK